MDDFLNVPPVVLENVDTVRARFDADATAGLDPSDPRYPDLTVGGFYWDTTQPAVIEAVREWDALTEMIAAMFPGTAWGEYLDLHGETIGVPRKDEVEASGEVMFTGAPGTLIPAGTVVSTVVADPSSSVAAQEFTTDKSITLAPTPGPTNLVPTGHDTGGTLPAGIFYYRVTALDAESNETIASNEAYVILTGATSKVDLTWTAVSGATGYNIYRSTIVGGETFLDTRDASAETYEDDGSPIPSTAVPPTNRVGITAAVAGSAGNVPTGTITLVLNPIDGSPAVTNDAPMSGGADVESDDLYRVRILLAYSAPKGGGVQADYERWALGFAPIGYVTVEPLWAGAGTVRVVVTDQQNQPVSAAVIQALQNYLDPDPGMGAGMAPIGAIVTVATPDLVPVTVAGTITFTDGYSLDGIGGTIATRGLILASIENYINRSRPGDDVVLNKVIGQVMLVPGVLDVADVLLNGSDANVTIGALEVATTSDGDITLS